MYIIKTYDHPFTYNDKELIAHISCKYDYEREAPEIGLESEEENEKYLQRFETGEYANILLCVVASCLGEKGEDWLGQVHIVSKDYENQINEAIIDHGMVANAIEELCLSIDKKVHLFKETLGLIYENK